MPQFRYAHAGGKDWRAAAQAVAAQLEGATGNLGFLYVDRHDRRQPARRAVDVP